MKHYKSFRKKYYKSDKRVLRKHFSEKTRRKISVAHNGKKSSLEDRLKIRHALIKYSLYWLTRKYPNEMVNYLFQKFGSNHKVTKKQFKKLIEEFNSTNISVNVK